MVSLVRTDSHACSDPLVAACLELKSLMPDLFYFILYIYFREHDSRALSVPLCQLYFLGFSYSYVLSALYVMHKLSKDLK